MSGVAAARGAGGRRVCFLGSTRHGRPLDPTQAKKWAVLAPLGQIFVVGFSDRARFVTFREHARFVLLPSLPGAPLRYLIFALAGTLIGTWLVLRRGVEIVVCQSPYEGFAGSLVKTLAALRGRRVALVVESHGDFERSLFFQRRVAFRWAYAMAMPRVARWVLGRADAMRAISGFTERQLASWAPGHPVVRFPAWTDFDVFWEAGDQPAERAPDVVYAGVLTPLKGVHVLLAAFGRVATEFPEARLWVIGPPVDAAYARNLAVQVEKAGLSDRVRFVGPLPQRDLARRMAGASVFVLPSQTEGLSRVILEAMASGMDVIASAVGGIPEIIEDGVTGWLVPAGDVEALAGRLREALGNWPADAELRRRARAFARGFVSVDAYVQGYARLFRLAEGAAGNCDVSGTGARRG